MKPIMCDVFCGRGGWTKGFQAHGWHCVGIDLYPQPDYPGEEFIQADIAHLIELPSADFYCCSSPCEQFSVFSLPRGFIKQLKWPWIGISLFEHSRCLLESTGKPYVMENVRAAQKFIGESDYHCGPFHLWGSGLPCLWPDDLRWLKKGIKFYRDPITGKRALQGLRATFSWEVEKRREISAKFAEIPESLSSHIALMAGAR